MDPNKLQAEIDTYVSRTPKFGTASETGGSILARREFSGNELF